MSNARSILAASAVAVFTLGPGIAPATAQVSMLNLDREIGDISPRTRDETAQLYASTIARLAEIIEKDIREDPGATVIQQVRAGNLDDLPSAERDFLDLVSSLNIRGMIIDTDPDPDPDATDDHILVFIDDGPMRQRVERSDIERQASIDGYRNIFRIQDGEILATSGSVTIPADPSTGLPEATVGVFLGIRGNDTYTTADTSSRRYRTRPCGAGYHGSGILEEKEIVRRTRLDGTTDSSGTGWMEVSRNCSPDQVDKVKILKDCIRPDRTKSQNVFEADRYVQKRPGNPYETEVHIASGKAKMIDDRACAPPSTPLGEGQYFLDGRVEGLKEFDLKSNTTPSDIGSGVNKIPVDTSTGNPVAGIPFPPSNVWEFQFLRQCSEEYGNITPPSGYRLVSTPDIFDGQITYYRDFIRIETSNSSDPNDYTLTYEVVTDPPPDGYPKRNRGTIDTSHGSAPAGDGWYKYSETCQAEILKDTTENRDVGCGARYPTYPDGDLQDSRTGVGHYTWTTADNPAPNGPTLQFVDWGNWVETTNNCHRASTTRIRENRTMTIVKPSSQGDMECSQDQYRFRDEEGRQYQDGTADMVTTYDPPSGWTNDGAPYSCSFAGYNQSGSGIKFEKR